MQKPTELLIVYKLLFEKMIKNRIELDFLELEIKHKRTDATNTLIKELTILISFDSKVLRKLDEYLMLLIEDSRVETVATLKN